MEIFKKMRLIERVEFCIFIILTNASIDVTIGSLIDFTASGEMDVFSL